MTAGKESVRRTIRRGCHRDDEIIVPDGVEADPSLRAALDWMRDHGNIDVVGVESTGSDRAGLARHLAAGVKVVEVNQPEKLDRHLDGKDDIIDAEASARTAMTGRAPAIPKSGDGPDEAIRSLEAGHESAAHDRVEATNQFTSMTFRALLGLRSAGPHSAAELLMAAGDHADRLHFDAAFAKLCAACRRPASSGKTVRFASTGEAVERPTERSNGS